MSSHATSPTTHHPATPQRHPLPARRPGAVRSALAAAAEQPPMAEKPARLRKPPVRQPRAPIDQSQLPGSRPAKPSQPSANQPAQRSASQPAARTINRPRAKLTAMPSDKVLALMKPGPEHAGLGRKAGTWDVHWTLWAHDGAEPTTGQGTASFTAVFGGRYLREDFTGDFHGTPFAGIGTMGFDRAAQQYVNTWYDSMGTGILCTSGSAVDDADDTLELRGIMSCPTERGETRVRHVHHWDTDDRFTVTMHHRDGDRGREWKAMVLVYTRKT